MGSHMPRVRAPSRRAAGIALASTMALTLAAPAAYAQEQGDTAAEEDVLNAAEQAAPAQEEPPATEQAAEENPATGDAQPAGPAARVGPIGDHGFPVWYEDTNGLRLELCLDQESGLCLLENPEPGQPISFPDNFGPEALWWAAESEMDVGDGGSALLVLALEAAFFNEEPVDGDQMTLGRVRIRLRDVAPNSTFTVTHPYGVDEVESDERGEARFTEDIGCLAAEPEAEAEEPEAEAEAEEPAAAEAEAGAGAGETAGCDFRQALKSRATQPLLTWDPAAEPAPPAGFVGDPAVGHTVVGSPNGTNFFRVEGPGIEATESDEFFVSGKIAGAAPPRMTADTATSADTESDSADAASGTETGAPDAGLDADLTNAESITLTGRSAPGTVRIFVDDTEAQSVEVAEGSYTATLDNLPEGVHTIAAQLDDGVSARSQATTVVVDRTAPRVTGMAADPTPFNADEARATDIDFTITDTGGNTATPGTDAQAPGADADQPGAGVAEEPAAEDPAADAEDAEDPAADAEDPVAGDKDAAAGGDATAQPTSRASAVTDVSVEIVEARSGSVVQTLTPDVQQAGTATAVAATWDGQTSRNEPAAAGEYRVVATATDAAGNTSEPVQADMVLQRAEPDSKSPSSTLWIALGLIAVAATVGGTILVRRQRARIPF